MSTYTLVTGATDGIGKETAVQLAKKGHVVIVHGRNPDKVAATAAHISKTVQGARVEAVVADLSSLEQTAQLAAEVAERFPQLNVLVNNAGVCVESGHSTTADGFELTYGVNHLAPSLLTLKLLPLLKKNSPSRIVMVASDAHKAFGMKAFGSGRAATTLDVRTLSPAAKDKEYSTFRQYSLSKLCNVHFSNELNRKLRADKSYDGVVVNSLHPGAITTNLLSALGFTGGSVAHGAVTSVMLAHDAKYATATGRYFSEGREANISALAADVDAAKALWEVTEKHLNFKPVF